MKSVGRRRGAGQAGGQREGREPGPVLWLTFPSFWTRLLQPPSPPLPSPPLPALAAQHHLCGCGLAPPPPLAFLSCFLLSPSSSLLRGICFPLFPLSPFRLPSASMRLPSASTRPMSLPPFPPTSLSPHSSTFWPRRNKGCHSLAHPARPPVQPSQRLCSDGMFQMESRGRPGKPKGFQSQRPRVASPRGPP